MDSRKAIYKPFFHKHPLFPSARFIKSKCGGCHVTEIMYGGYFCNKLECGDWLFHKKCVEASLEINHPFHSKHPLFLTNDHSINGHCKLCEQILLPPYYSCYICQFNIHLACGLICDNVYTNTPSFSLWKVVNNPCHSNHPLNLISFDTLMDDAEKSCILCEEQLKNIFYHCSICNFSMCHICNKNPPPLVVEHIKTHKHPLTCFSRRNSYICDACGQKGNTMPYICLQCDFIIHGTCIDLPRVININRHDHHISFTYYLGPGYSNCGICHQNLSRYYGAYSCSICLNYAAHTGCALKRGVWDYIELQEIRNDTEYIIPFKVVGDELIIHFSHEKHLLRLHKDNAIHSKWLKCEACIYPIGFEPIYNCEECDFVLHEKCANLLMKKRLVFDIRLYNLEVVTGCERCDYCDIFSNGFKYKSYMQDKVCIDVQCSSLSEPLFHYGHLHPLYFHKPKNHSCDGCRDDIDHKYVFRCDACDFDLCFYCANLPFKIWHRNDEHPLTLYCGQKVIKKIWCNNCEIKLDPCKWFYVCFDCEVTMHVRCVLGDFSRLNLEEIVTINGEIKFKVVLNNHNTRPLCSQCHSRCKFSIILKVCDENNGYICSNSCLELYRQ